MEHILNTLMSYNPEKFGFISDLIEETHETTRGVYVNRTLRMDEIKYIGFDMDYTLAIYNKREIEETAFELTLGKLIDIKKYPDFIQDLKYDPNYVIRGLVIDKKHGNILKLDRHKYVRRGDHGTTMLSSKEIRECYPTDI